MCSACWYWRSDHARMCIADDDDLAVKQPEFRCRTASSAHPNCVSVSVSFSLKNSMVRLNPSPSEI